MDKVEAGYTEIGSGTAQDEMQGQVVLRRKSRQVSLGKVGQSGAEWGRVGQSGAEWDLEWDKVGISMSSISIYRLARLDASNPKYLEILPPSDR